MKLIIAGSRDLFVSSAFIDDLLVNFSIKKDVEEIVSGNHGGIDMAGEEYSIDYLDKDAKTFPADWSKGLQAGRDRNQKMADYADAMLLIWDGKSDGSADIKTRMLSQKKPIHEVVIKVKR